MFEYFFTFGLVASRKRIFQYFLTSEIMSPTDSFVFSFLFCIELHSHIWRQYEDQYCFWPKKKTRWCPFEYRISEHNDHCYHLLRWFMVRYIQPILIMFNVHWKAGYWWLVIGDSNNNNQHQIISTNILFGKFDETVERQPQHLLCHTHTHVPCERIEEYFP